jgi:succinate dehydrogenase/fumarate reductase iron-sulfur protein
MPEDEKTFIDFMVYRFDPARDNDPYYIIYEVPYRRGMTVLDGLLYIIEELDPTLSVRYNCRFKICGSCAMMVDGVQKLACGAQVKGKKVRVDPLSHFKVIKDLVVDIEPFLEKMESVLPYLTPRENTEKNRILPEEFEKYNSPSDCILCGACTSACPIAATEPYYVGPASLNQLYRFTVDSREREGYKDLRLILGDNGKNGVWRCHQAFACKNVCPKNINPGKSIAQLKRMIIRSRIFK